ncbi:hypothetical protein EVAR_12453_1 [Eumeta japonica]|uniref:Uncharacterized protein n=1 Tax=Eumeta variegata TaxID=151549 RepID=A0A4C1TPE9_EUMVA|nr:hypothetical protein EVAR_12453_1 [Eumeta japonica]
MQALKIATSSASNGVEKYLIALLFTPSKSGAFLGFRFLMSFGPHLLRPKEDHLWEGASVIVFDLPYADLHFTLEGTPSKPILKCGVCARTAEGCVFSSYQFANVGGQDPAI